MAFGLGFQLSYLLPALAIMIAAAAPHRPLSANWTRAAIAMALGTLAVAAGSRVALIIWSLRGGAPSGWDAGIQAIAGAWLHGQPIQPALSDGLFYRWAYGPLHYEVVGLTQLWLGIGNPWVGLPMALAELAAVIVTWRAARNMGISPRAATLAVGVMVAELGLLDIGGVRSDQLLVLLAAVGLAAAQSAGRRSGAAILLGLCGGLSMALKFTGFLYVVPALLPLLVAPGSARVRTLAYVAMGGVIGALTPYLVPGAGITLQIFREETSNFRPMVKAFGHNLLFTMIALLPPLLWCPTDRRRARARQLGWIVLPWVPIFVIACNGAAGPWHLAPFLPAVTLYLARSLDEQRGVDARHLGLIGALALLVTIEVRQRLPQTFDLASAASNARLQHRIRAFLAAHPGDEVAIGSGSGRRVGSRASTSDVTFSQAEIPRAGRMLRFMEQSFVLVNSPATAKIVAQKLFSDCAVRYWITAPGPVFSGRLYDPSLQRVFRARYRLIQSDADMAIWACTGATT